MAVKKTGISRELLVHPGETIADVIEDRGITQAELALRTGVTPTYVSNVINGKKDISAKFALALEYALGVNKTFWLNLQANYEAELLELTVNETVTDEEREARNHLNVIVRYLRRLHLLPVSEKKDDSIISLRNVLKISNLANLPRFAGNNSDQLANAVRKDPYIIGAWVCLGAVNRSEEIARECGLLK